MAARQISCCFDTRRRHRFGPRKAACGVLWVRTQCCKIGYVGGFSDAELTGSKAVHFALSTFRVRLRARCGSSKLDGSFVSGRPERCAKHPCADESGVARRESGKAAPRRWVALLCLWAAHHWPQRVAIAARGTPRHAPVRGGAGAAAIGLPLSVGGAIISATPWSPRPKHHRKKKQRHRLC